MVDHLNGTTKELSTWITKGEDEHQVTAKMTYFFYELWGWCEEVYANYVYESLRDSYHVT